MNQVFDFEAQAAPMRAAATERSPAEMMEQQQSLSADLKQNVVAKALDVGELAPNFMRHRAGTETEQSLTTALANGPVGFRSIEGSDGHTAILRFKVCRAFTTKSRRWAARSS